MAELLRDYADGASAPELARQFAVDPSTVYAHLNRHAAKPRRYRKLRGDQLQHAIRLHQSGVSIRAIASELGLNRETVRKALAVKPVPPPPLADG